MAKSIRFGGNTYLDDSAIVIDNVGTTLDSFLTNSKTDYSNSVDTTYMGTTHGAYVFRRCGIKVLRLNLSVNQSLPAGSYTTIFTLSSADRASDTFLAICDASNSQLIRVNITSTSVQLYAEAALTSDCWLRCVIPFV